MKNLPVVVAAAMMAAIPAAAEAGPKVCSPAGTSLVFAVRFETPGQNAVKVQRIGDNADMMTFNNFGSGFSTFSMNFPGMSGFSTFNSFGMGGMSGMSMGMGGMTPFGMSGMSMGGTGPSTSSWSTAMGSWQSPIHGEPTCYRLIAGYDEGQGAGWQPAAYWFDGNTIVFSGAGGHKQAVRVTVTSPGFSPRFDAE